MLRSSLFHACGKMACIDGTILSESSMACYQDWLQCGAVIEKYTRNTRFCLICNYASKIIPALQSRCTRFRFPPLQSSFVEARLKHVIDAEGCGMPLYLATNVFRDVEIMFECSGAVFAVCTAMSNL